MPAIVCCLLICSRTWAEPAGSESELRTQFEQDALVLDYSLEQNKGALSRKPRKRVISQPDPPLRLSFELLLPVAARVPAATAFPAGIAPEQTAESQSDRAEVPQPFFSAIPGTASGKPPSPAEKTKRLPEFTLIEGWVIPPIRWRGNLSNNYNFNTNSDHNQSLSTSNAINIGASSYVYQPWFAQVSGSLGFSKGDSRQKTSGTGSETKSSSSSLTYDGNLNLFPQSRFPLQAYVQQNDSRARAKESSVEYSSTRFGVRQSYRPLVGQENYSGNFDHSVVATGNNHSEVNALQGAYTNSFDKHSINASAQISGTNGDIGGQQSNLLNLSGNHTWRMNELLTVSTQANFMDNQIRGFSGNALISNKTQLFQLNNSFSWIPEKELPLTLVGGGNFLSLLSDTGATKNELMNLNGYLSSNYRISERLNAYAGMTATQNTNNGTGQFITTQNGAISYSGEPLTFGNYLYNWGSGLGVNNQTSSLGAGTHGWSGQAQHSLQRSIVFDKAGVMSLSAGQSASVNGSSQSEQSSSISNSGGGMWQFAVGERATGMLSVTATDTMTSGNYSSHLFNLLTQGSMQMQLSSRSAMSSSLHFNYQQQIKAPRSSGVAPSGPNLDGVSNTSGAGVITYSHRNPFDFIGLYYSASFMINISETNQRVLTGNPNANAWQVGSVFQQSLEYRIGRLGLRATTSLADLNGKENASVFFSVNRDFGDY